MLTARCTFGYRLPLGTLEHTFRPGVLYALTGPNGSGKSTLVDTLAGELAPLEGSVLIDDLPVTLLPGAHRVVKIASPEFYPDLSVGEHIALLRTPATARERWQLDELAEFPPQWLSSGQQQRVFLGAQLAQEADVYLLDEPERHLDDAWTHVLIDELLATTDRAAVIVATHSADIIAAADEVIRL